MYCVKCGVELADSERKCPLCHTPVYMPGLDEHPELPYPAYNGEGERVNPKGIYFIVSFFFLIAAAISLICDININGAVSWSSYALGGLIVAYVIFVLPGWFYRPNPAIFLPIDFAAAALYLCFVNLLVDGGWFLSFAFPVCGIAALIFCVPVILIHYIRRGRLYILGGAFIAAGGFSILIEFLMNITFDLRSYFLWSSYPAVALSLLGIMLIVVAIVKPFKESLRRIFSI